MATNFMLKIDGAGIKGESPVDGYTDYMQLTSVSFGGNHSGTFGTGGGGGGGKFTAEDFEFSMWTNKATPKILEACANGSHLKTATFVALKAGGGKAVEYLKVTLSDVIVSRAKTEYKPIPGVKTDEHTIDFVGLNYSKIAVEYKEQKADGSAGATVEGGWDLAKQKAGK